MMKWDLPDSPVWEDGLAPYVTVRLQDICLLRWRSAVASHVLPYPYLLLQPVPSEILKEAVIQAWPWQTQLRLRGWCRLRTGLVRLGHVNGRRSDACMQKCIFCDTEVPVSALGDHVMGQCEQWNAQRARWSSIFEGGQPDPPSFAVVCASQAPGPAFWAAIEFADLVEAATSKWWKDCHA